MMKHSEIRGKIDQLKWWGIESQPGFVLEYETLTGAVSRYGRHLGEPIRGDILFDEWVGEFAATGLIPVSTIVSLWTENDQCPTCDEPGVDLDTLAHFDEPTCQPCATEALETDAAEGLLEDMREGI